MVESFASESLTNIDVLRAESEKEPLINILARELSSPNVFKDAPKGDAVPKIAEATAHVHSAVHDLMPLPKSLTETGEALPIRGGVKLSFTGFKDPLLEHATTRFLAGLHQRTGLLPDDKLPGATLKIEVNPDPAYGTVKESEGYKLNVDKQGVVLKADGQAGVLRGLATLMQLVELSPNGFQFAGARIEDSPRFAWRGLLMDPARHFISIETLKRQIDAMEAVKLNVLHLHLSDNEGFRVESKSFPELNKKASNAEYYTQEQIKDLIDYARDRGVRIVPEFDMPGHSGSEVKAYPEIGTPTGANSAPAGVLDPSKESTYKFLESFLDEMTQLFPDAYYHMGGDEVNGGNWDRDPGIQEFKQQKGLKDNVQLQAYFTNRVHEMLDKRGKTMLGWDEIVNPDLPPDVLVQSWRSYNMTAKTAQAGYPLIVSNGYYLDMLSSADKHYIVDPTEATDYQQADDGTQKTEERIKLTPEEKSKFIGGEAAMWGEIATDEMIDARNWPRSAAIAERYWSPSSVRDLDDMYRRLIVVDTELSILGLQQHENSQRMVSRLAPGQEQVLDTFLSAVRPSPNWSHYRGFRNGWKAGEVQQQFNELADAATPDALRAKSAELDVKGFLADGPKADLLLAIHPFVRLLVEQASVTLQDASAKPATSLR